MNDYRAAPSWLAPNSGDGLRTGERFLRCGKDGTFILRILDDELVISKDTRADAHVIEETVTE